MKKKIKKIIKLIKKYLGEIFIAIGAFITIYNLLDFTHHIYSYTGLPVRTFYYYTDTVKFMIAFGVFLVIIGILIIKSKKKQNL